MVFFFYSLHLYNLRSISVNALLLCFAALLIPYLFGDKGLVGILRRFGLDSLKTSNPRLTAVVPLCLYYSLSTAELDT